MNIGDILGNAFVMLPLIIAVILIYAWEHRG